MVDASSLFLRLASALVLLLSVLYQTVMEGWGSLWVGDVTWSLVAHLQGLGWGGLALPGAVVATAGGSIAVVFWIFGMLCRTVSFLFAAVVGTALLFGGLSAMESTVACLFLVPAIALVIQGGGVIGVDGFLRARRGKTGKTGKRGKRGKTGKRGGGPYRMIGS